MSSTAPFALVGPTASGKTALAMELAAMDGTVELVSVDAFSCYRHLDIGTAKPDQAMQQAVAWHLIDILDPEEELSIAHFSSCAAAALSSIASRGHRPGYVGGSGLYLRAVLDGLSPPPRFPEVAAALEAEADLAGSAALHRRLGELDPVGASRMEPTNRRRIVRALEVTLGSGRPFSSFGPGLEHYGASEVIQVGLFVEREVLDKRLRERLDEQLASGFLDEVAALRGRPGGLSRTAAQAIGYRELGQVLDGELDVDQAREEILRRSRTLARRQLAWLRRDPRIHWVEATESDLCSTVAGLVGIDVA